MKITEITTETEISRDDLLAAIAEGEAALDTALEIESPTAEQIAEGRKRVDHCGSITPS